jgi:hypothetical protein
LTISHKKNISTAIDTIDSAIDINQVVLIELELLKDRIDKDSDRRYISHLESRILKNSEILVKALNREIAG